MALSDFALNRPILEQVKLIIDADIVTYTVEEEVLATTLDEVQDVDLLARIRSAESAPRGVGIRNRPRSDRF